MWRLLALALLHLARTAADTSTAERIRSGQTSSFEEISRHLARAFRHEHDLRAYVSIFGAEALRAAAARDRVSPTRLRRRWAPAAAAAAAAMRTRVARVSRAGSTTTSAALKLTATTAVAFKL